LLTSRAKARQIKFSNQIANYSFDRAAIVPRTRTRESGTVVTVYHQKSAYRLIFIRFFVVNHYFDKGTASAGPGLLMILGEWGGVGVPRALPSLAGLCILLSLQLSSFNLFPKLKKLKKLLLRPL
jgi:hypothetical protein